MQLIYLVCIIFLFVYATDISYLCHKDRKRDVLAEIRKGKKLKPANARARGNNLLEGTSDVCINFSIH